MLAAKSIWELTVYWAEGHHVSILHYNRDRLVTKANMIVERQCPNRLPIDGLNYDEAGHLVESEIIIMRGEMINCVEIKKVIRSLE